MNIIKLNATASTNDFLKDMAVTNKVENYTVVVTDNQLNGKGQRGNSWQVEPGKNLTFSIFLNDFNLEKFNFFLLNVIVPISIVEVLKRYSVPDLKIKWPNDILADNNKIGGILIENSFKSQQDIQSIIGIGLNVNQKSFENLEKASSLFKIMGFPFDKEELLLLIVNQIKLNIDSLDKVDESEVWKKYHEYLFRKDKPSTFQDKSNVQFVGIIRKVTTEGLLEVELEDKVLKLFDIKEVRLLY